MNTIDRKNYYFSPSVNIIRDKGEQIDYILTPNAELVHSQLVTGFQIGVRAYNLVGAYGTGKSAFLKAFENDIINLSNNFPNKSISCSVSRGIEFIFITKRRLLSSKTFELS